MVWCLIPNLIFFTSTYLYVMWVQSCSALIFQNISGKLSRLLRCQCVSSWKDELFPSVLNLLQTMDLVLGAKLSSSGKRSSNLWEEWVTGKILSWSEGQSWGPEGTWPSLQGYRDSEGRKRCCQERENRSYHPERSSTKGILSSPSGIASLHRCFFLS